MRTIDYLKQGLLGAGSLCLLAAPSAWGYSEAPLLAEHVAAGELPPVEDRLPEEPLVVEPVEQTGQYGGTWRRIVLNGADMMLTSRMGYDPLVRWARDGRTILPNMATSWEILDEGRTYVLHLRKGLKWSDGAPLTAADFEFYINDVLACSDLMPVFPAWLRTGDEPVRFSAPDPYSLVFEFAQPYSVFLEVLAFRGNAIVLPKHYMKQFHKDYVSEQALAGLIEEHGYVRWQELFGHRSDYNENPELPTWRAFKVAVPAPAMRMLAERNPYYWKADPAGNQLPYIDQVAFTEVNNNEMVTFKAMAGEADFQARRIDASAYALFMENRDQGDYRVMRDPTPGNTVLYLNQCSKDPVLRGTLKDRRFRIAMSIAVNREELIFLMYSGMAQPSRGVASPHDPYFLPEFEEKYLEYDPERANALLDEVGLKRGANGMRRLPDGRPFRQMLHVFRSETGTSSQLWQLVADYYRDVGLDFVVKAEAVALSRLQVCNGNSDFWAYANSGLHWVTDPVWYVPLQRSSFFCPLYGRYAESDGRDAMGVKPPPEFQRLLDWYHALLRAHGPDAQGQKLEFGHKILRQWAEECYVVGICREELLTIVKNDFRNVPDHIIHDFRVMTPGYIGIEQFYFEQCGSSGERMVP